MVGTAEYFYFPMSAQYRHCSVPVLRSSAINHITLCQLFQKTNPVNKGTVRMREVAWKMKIRTERSGGVIKGDTEGVQECDW